MSGAKTPSVYRFCDTASGALILFMIVWAPWAFGCTVSWAIWTLCGGAYTLGLLLAVKGFLRWRNDYTPERWASPTPVGTWAVRLLATLTVLMLAYVLVSWINARATLEFPRRAIDGVQIRYHDRSPLTWLPSTYDAPRTLRAFWRYLALALGFWATRDWLLGKTRSERRDDTPRPFPPARLRRLLWTLSISSAVLALVGIVQRLDGTDKLLWILKPVIMNTAFGPYNYRTNAAQYFNLVWPVALGFWWALRKAHLEEEEAGSVRGSGAYIMLIPCVVLMAACPIISTSRGGSLILAGQFLGSLGILAFAQGKSSLLKRLAGIAVLGLGLGLGWFLGGEALQERFKTVFTDRMSGRLDLYEVGYRMAKDAGPWGTGAETFTGLYSLYRTNTDAIWEAFCHNDWLETRITFGWLGFSILILMLILVPVMHTTHKGLRPPREFTLLLLLALVGCLIHARFDFPLQMYSLIYLFLTLTATLTTCAGKE